MAIKLIQWEQIDYPHFQAEGFAAKFAIPFAEQVCTGVGYDIGCNKKEWALPGSIPVDPALKDGSPYDAMNLPAMAVNFIFSSHCLEHLPDWVRVLDYWTTKIATGGTLFLYLPDASQFYWRPWANTKHLHVFTPEIIRSYLVGCKMYKNIFVSGVDLNNSFMAMAEKI